MLENILFCLLINRAKVQKILSTAKKTFMQPPFQVSVESTKHIDLFFVFTFFSVTLRCEKVVRMLCSSNGADYGCDTAGLGLQPY